MWLLEIAEEMRKNIVNTKKYIRTCQGEKEYPKKQKLQLERLKVQHVALRCWISKISVQRIASTEDKVPENSSLFVQGRKNSLYSKRHQFLQVTRIKGRRLIFFMTPDGAYRNSSCHRLNY